MTVVPTYAEVLVSHASIAGDESTNPDDEVYVPKQTETPKKSLVDNIPTISGTIRAKFEYSPAIDKSRTQMRNARLAFTGNVTPKFSYKAEVDLCDQGSIKMLDAYIRYKTNKHWSITVGQSRVPFSIDAHRSPYLQYFANRSFIAKEVGNIRDVGIMAKYSGVWGVPVSIEGGMFNGSGLTEQKDYWTNHYNFDAKAIVGPFDNFTLQASVQESKPESVTTIMCDVGGYFDNGIWHIEGEYLHKHYTHNAYHGVHAVDAFILRRFPVQWDECNRISGQLRYDFMTDQSEGAYNEEGELEADDPGRHRITGGVTLGFGSEKLMAELRVNYEKYFYQHDAAIPISGHDKIVFEVMVHF